MPDVIRRFAPLGFRFWDAATDEPVVDGLRGHRAHRRPAWAVHAGGAAHRAAAARARHLPDAREEHTLLLGRLEG
jgi:hypothetical protein